MFDVYVTLFKVIVLIHKGTFCMLDHRKWCRSITELPPSCTNKQQG